MVMATQADSHREWHLNTGIPMGTPGCPQDACHPIEDEDRPPADWNGVMVTCGNRAAHPHGVAKHWNAADVRECFALSGRFNSAVKA